jgi:hypothetical protein
MPVDLFCVKTPDYDAPYKVFRVQKKEALDKIVYTKKQ